MSNNETTLESLRKDIAETYNKNIPVSTLLFLTDGGRTHIAELTGHRIVTDDAGAKCVMITANIIETTRPSRNRASGDETAEEAPKPAAKPAKK
jgi:hypothetical protein